jgi:maltose O-acetyltransferase
MGTYFWLVVYYGLARHLPKSYSFGGTFGQWLRNFCCRHIFAHCDRTANIERGCHFGRGNQISVGFRASLGVNSELHGPITIGDNVMMGPDTLIHTENHETSSVEVPMIDQGITARRPVVVGDDVWLGARVIILPGVRIGDGTVVGAGAVVAKDMPSYSIVAGNPCRVVRHRVPPESE